ALVSRDPLWSPDGKELFYLRNLATGVINSINTYTSALTSEYRESSRWIFTLSRVSLFGKAMPLPIEGISLGPHSYDITPNGKYFVVMLPKTQAEGDKAPPEQIKITLNWFRELQERVSRELAETTTSRTINSPQHSIFRVASWLGRVAISGHNVGSE